MNDTINIFVNDLANAILRSSFYKDSEELQESFRKLIHDDLEGIIHSVVLGMLKDENIRTMIKMF